MSDRLQATPAPSPDDALRRRMLEAAARLLGEEGPSALSTRRLAREAGTSTMAVYTHFGGMPALVREVVAEGFARLEARVGAVPPTDDTLADLRALAAAYRANALANPHLYAVMFGSASLGGYRLHDEERAVGLVAFGQLVAGIVRAMDAGALRRGDPAVAAGQVWTALHGYVMLELAGFQHVVDDPEHTLLWPLLDHLVDALT
ncbi:MAG: TetR/AcrR family transcriptional regulator [Nocardioides sp.]